MACGFRFEIPYKNKPGTIFLNWHDGGMKPDIPYGYPEDDLPLEGMMFTGDRGAIVAGFRGANPQLYGLSPADMRRFALPPAAEQPQQRGAAADPTPAWMRNWIDNIKGVSKNPGSFEFVRELTETYNLGAVSMMRNGIKLTYDPASRTVTNDSSANRLLYRETRRGWEFI